MKTTKKALRAKRTSTDIAVDAQGNVYVTGHSGVPGFDDDFATLKYDANGNPSSTWPDIGSGTGVRKYDRAGGYDHAWALALDAAGNVYVTGMSMGGGGTSWDIITLKYDQNGSLSGTWPNVGYGTGVRRYDGAASGYDSPADIVYHAGSLYVIGFSATGGGFSARDHVTIKYNASNGSKDWDSLYDGEGQEWTPTQFTPFKPSEPNPPRRKPMSPGRGTSGCPSSHFLPATSSHLFHMYWISLGFLLGFP